MDPATNADGRRLEALLKAELPRLRVRLPANDDTNTTLPKGRAAAVVALPASTDQVAAVLRTAGKHGAAVYPVSCGNNWGYGDRLPVRPGGILLDLSGMKAIHEVHPDLGYAVVEPGVTYWDLTAHLARTGLPFWADVTGAGPHTSVLGNTLERGFGHTAHADHYANSAGYEVVLADGTTLTTGFGPAARAAYCHKPGVGPALDGLFSQSNLGVVTRMGVWLQPAPEHHAAFALTATDPAAVGPLVDRLRPLRQLGVAPTCVHIANDYRAASATRRFPFSDADPARGLSPAQRRAVCGPAAWTALGGLYGTRRTVRAAYAEVERATRGVAACRLLTPGRVKWAKRLARWVGRPSMHFRAEAAEQALGLLTGRPTTYYLAGAGWRNRLPAWKDPSPREEGCGAIMVAPVAPLTGADVAACLAVAEGVFAEFCFEPLVTVNLVSGRAACLVLTVCYDRTNKTEADRAGRCADALLARTTAAGFPSYRRGTWAMGERLGGPDDPYWQTVARLKAALDPAGVLAPGRYQAG